MEENGLNLVQCSNCGWFHVGVSLEQAWAQVKSFNDYFVTLAPEEQIAFYGGKLSTIDSYLYCFNCGAFCSVLQKPEKLPPNGVTLQSIVAHSDLVFDRAEQDEILVYRDLLRRASELIKDARDHEPVSPLAKASFECWLRDYSKIK